MTTIKQLLATAALVGFTAIPASAATTLYNETFSSPFEGAVDGTGPLNGTTPNITVGINTWTASEWRENGTAPTTTLDSANDDSAFLAFAPTVGMIYTLSATLTQPAGGDANGWAGIGFTGGNTTTGSFFNNNAAPWVLWRPSDAPAASEVVTRLGPALAGNESEGAFTGTATFDIVLNTQAALWTAEWFVNGVSVRSTPYGTNPTITHIGLGRENGQSATFTNFSLTAIPEPSTALLGGLGMLALLRRRRN